MALVLDSCLHVFNHDFGESSTDNEVITVDVNAMIDGIAWTPCRNFVLLALRSGYGQLVHIPTKVPLPPVPILDYSKEESVEKDCNLSNGKQPKSFAGCWIEESEIDEKS